MEVITIDGRQFVKASAAARQAGYTSDYVGQLARADAIPAKLIGRTWYVDAEALRSHRVEKKRFAREKAREQVKKAIQEKKALDASPRGLGGARTSSLRLPVYDKDEADLMPKIEKTTPLTGVETVVVSAEEKDPKGEYTPITVTVMEAKTPLKKHNKEDKVEEPVRKVSAARHRQVIAPRKKMQKALATAQKSAPTTPAVNAESRPVAREEKKTARVVPRDKRRTPRLALTFFVLSVPVAFILASLEIHTMYNGTASLDLVRNEYVIDIGIFRALFAELWQL